MSADPLFIGKDLQLFGIREVPEGDQRDTAVVLLNAGVLHSAGPFRLHVTLSNRLSRIGFPVFRIDQSGKGESPRRHGIDRLATVLADYDDVYEELQKIGVKDVILIGLCWGADDAIRIAHNRDSVSGVVTLDGFAHKNLPFKLWAILNRITSPRSWRRLFLRLTFRGKQLNEGQPSASFAENMALRDWPNDDEMVGCYRKLLGRGVKMLSVFTRGQEYYNHTGQLEENLGSDFDGNGLQEVFYQDSDHTFSLTHYRERLIKLIEGWAAAQFEQDSSGIANS